MWTVAVLALLATGCGQAGETQGNEAPAEVQSEGQRALHQLNETDRAIGLKRAIHESGFQCQRIDRSAFVQKYETLEMWAAACNDGRGWGLFVGRDETVQVRSCKDLVSLKLPRCPSWAENAPVTR
jgi:hypothetical protein